MSYTILNALENLINAAERENWVYVDDMLSELQKAGQLKGEYAAWAYVEGIEDKDDRVRDLAGSILEKASIPESFFNTMRQIIGDAMKNEIYFYPKFRLACTLAAHGLGEYKEDVISVMENSLEDEDVKEIAEEYIEQLEKKK